MVLLHLPNGKRHNSTYGHSRPLSIGVGIVALYVLAYYRCFAGDVSHRDYLLQGYFDYASPTSLWN